ncbi:hypothetical protein [Nocardioides campestrisoli]|nr:hypothetical protein [Nocardioides campestrisoli]
MATTHPAVRARDEDRKAELWGLAMLWFVPCVGFLMAVLGLGY